MERDTFPSQWKPVHIEIAKSLSVKPTTESLCWQKIFGSCVWQSAIPAIAEFLMCGQNGTSEVVFAHPMYMQHVVILLHFILLLYRYCCGLGQHHVEYSRFTVSQLCECFNTILLKITCCQLSLDIYYLYWRSISLCTRHYVNAVAKQLPNFRSYFC